ncbi:MAG: flippase [Cyanobacteriota bacterium]|nr:flippase [Cyanobacteriota bacterium]
MLHRFLAIGQKLSPVLRQVIGNIGWLAAERLLTMVLSLCVGIYTIRYLGAEDFGKLSYSTSFVALFAAIAKLGLDAIVVRNSVRNPSKVPEILGTTFVLKLGGGLLAFICAAGSILTFNSDREIRSMTLIIAIGFIFQAFDTIELWFQSQVLSGRVAMLRGVQFVVNSLTKILLIALQCSVIAFAYLFCINSIVKAVGTVLLYRQHGQSLAIWQVSAATAMELIKNAYPLIFSGVMITIYMKIDQVMLGNLVGERAVGNYAAAVRFSEIWYFVPAAICTSIFPAVVRAKENERDYYRKLQQLYDIMVGLSLSIAMPMTLFSGALIGVLLDKEYAQAGEILGWHIWASLFVFLGVASSKWSIAENYVAFNFAATASGAIANVLLNLWLIPLKGGVGAAIATMGSYAIATPLAYFFYPPAFRTGLMLIKALLLPFRFRDNLKRLKRLKQYIRPL